MNEPFRLRYTNQIVGVFLLLVLLIVFTVLLLRASRYFATQDHYWIEMTQDEIGYLHQNADVMILGERAGKVESIRYIENSDKVQVNLSIDPDKSPDIFKNSIVRLERKFGIGTPVLVIRRAVSEDAQMQSLPPGSQITNFQGEADRLDKVASEVEVVSDSVRKIQVKMDPTLTSIEQAADRFQQSLATTVDPAFTQAQKASESFFNTNEVIRPKTLETLDAMQQATTNLEQRIESLTQKMELVVEQDMRRALTSVDESTDDVSETAKTITRVSEEVNQEVNETLSVLREAAETVQKLAKDTKDLVRVLRKEANDLPGTTARVNETLGDTQDMVGEIRSHWLLRRYSDQPQSTSQISPSGIRGGASR